MKFSMLPQFSFSIIPFLVFFLNCLHLLLYRGEDRDNTLKFFHCMQDTPVATCKPYGNTHNG